MIEALLVVLTNPVDGRDNDFNDWYTNIHTRDAMRFRGSIAQQRFTFAAEQVQDYPDGFLARYLALYEVYDRTGRAHAYPSCQQLCDQPRHEPHTRLRETPAPELCDVWNMVCQGEGEGQSFSISRMCLRKTTMIASSWMLNIAE